MEQGGSVSLLRSEAAAPASPSPLPPPRCCCSPLSSHLSRGPEQSPRFLRSSIALGASGISCTLTGFFARFPRRNSTGSPLLCLLSVRPSVAGSLQLPSPSSLPLPTSAGKPPPPPPPPPNRRICPPFPPPALLLLLLRPVLFTPSVAGGNRPGDGRRPHSSVGETGRRETPTLSGVEHRLRLRLRRTDRPTSDRRREGKGPMGGRGAFTRPLLQFLSPNPNAQLGLVLLVLLLLFTRPFLLRQLLGKSFCAESREAAGEGGRGRHRYATFELGGGRKGGESRERGLSWKREGESYSTLSTRWWIQNKPCFLRGGDGLLSSPLSLSLSLPPSLPPSSPKGGGGSVRWKGAEEGGKGRRKVGGGGGERSMNGLDK